MYFFKIIFKFILTLSLLLFLSNCSGGESNENKGNNPIGGSSESSFSGERNKNTGNTENNEDTGNTGNSEDNGNNGDSEDNGDGGNNEDGAEEETKLYGIPLNASPLNYDQYHLPSLTNSEFDALSEQEKYRVALKLYATFFYGTSSEELNATIHSGAFISQTQQLFDQANDVSEISSVEEHLLDYKGWGTGKVMIPMLARLYHLSPGKAYLNRWAAYILTQSIFFSPAYELDTVYTVDALNVYNSLVRDLDDGLSLQWITFKHMMTDENWRRFRSPEDNGREMLEIYLMDFNDAHIPLAAKALKNWKLDKKSNMLVITLDENTEPITTLFEGTTVTNGTDFYSAIVLQPNFLTTVCRRLVDIYFPHDTEVQKNNIVTQLSSSQPTAWTDLLKEIVYSKAYLLQSEKTRSFEESFYPIAKTLNWHPHAYSFYIAYDRLNKMHQSTMRYKLGRKTEVPLDSQSFAWFHKTIRENIMINYENNPSFDSWDDGWNLTELYKTLPNGIDTKEKVAQYIVQTLFMSIAGREAKSAEKQFFLDMIDETKHNSTTFNNYPWITMIGNDNPQTDWEQRGYFALMVLDYLSRLNTTYAFEAAQ